MRVCQRGTVQWSDRPAGRAKDCLIGRCRWAVRQMDEATEMLTGKLASGSVDCKDRLAGISEWLSDYISGLTGWNVDRLDKWSHSFKLDHLFLHKCQTAVGSVWLGGRDRWTDSMEGQRRGRERGRESARQGYGIMFAHQHSDSEMITAHYLTDWLTSTWILICLLVSPPFETHITTPFYFQRQTDKWEMIRLVSVFILSLQFKVGIMHCLLWFATWNVLVIFWGGLYFCLYFCNQYIILYPSEQNDGQYWKGLTG